MKKSYLIYEKGELIKLFDRSSLFKHDSDIYAKNLEGYIRSVLNDKE